jgi:hypothetical protein
VPKTSYPMSKLQYLDKQSRFVFSLIDKDLIKERKGKTGLISAESSHKTGQYKDRLAIKSHKSGHAWARIRPMRMYMQRVLLVGTRRSRAIFADEPL